MFDLLRKLLPARAQSVAHGAHHRARRRRPRALDAARLCGAGARGLCEERHRASRGAAGRRERRRRCRSLLYEGDAERDTHPLLDLLARPNPRQDGAAFLESVARICCSPATPMSRRSASTGEDGAPVRELYALRPDRMQVVPGPDGWPEAYEYTVGGATRALRPERRRCRRSCI